MAVSITSGRSVFCNASFLKYILLALATLLVTFQLFRQQSYLKAAWTNVPKDPAGIYEAKNNPKVKNAGNSTMGFEKIIVINLPERSDRRDRMSLISAHTGIDIEYSDGIKGEDVDPKAVPPHWETNPTLVQGNLGSYRSHVMALRRVVEKGYRTAIIMEDDLDWDLGIKDQLRLFATHLSSIPNSEFAALSRQANQKTPKAPYGLEWDIMWLGTCMRPDPPPNTYSYQDPISEETTYVWNNKEGVACSHAYAVTYESAKTLLAYALDLNSPWDLHLSDFCLAHVCPLVSPPLIGFHQPAGAASKASDISSATGPEYREKGQTFGVKHSALLDLTDELYPKKTFPPFKPAAALKPVEASKPAIAAKPAESVKPPGAAKPKVAGAQND